MKKDSKIPKKHKESPHELKHPEDSFFQKTATGQSINNVKRRLFGIQSAKAIHHLQNDDKSRHEKISSVLHTTKNLANCLAYSAHNGRNWQRDNLTKMQR